VQQKHKKAGRMKIYFFIAGSFGYKKLRCFARSKRSLSWYISALKHQDTKFVTLSPCISLAAVAIACAS
jgi:hypothetical protein